MSELPATLTGLQRAPSRRQLSCNEAMAAQRQRLELLDSDHHCVVQTLPAGNTPLDDGALAGVGLAHKNIFDTLDRRPGVGHDRGSIVRGLRPATAIERSQRHGAANRRGGDFQNINLNKRSMTLNLKRPGARDILIRLVKDADVLVENWRPEVKKRLGLDYASLAAVN